MQVCTLDLEDWHLVDVVCKVVDSSEEGTFKEMGLVKQIWISEDGIRFI